MIPNFIKPFIRFIYYKNERKKVIREIAIRQEQNQLIKRFNTTKIENLIVFIVDGTNWFTGKDNISGGILSIASIYEETCKLKEIHGAEVIMVTHPKAHLLLKHTQFPNNIPVFRFSQLRHFLNVKKLMVHIPEYMTSTLLADNIQRIFKQLGTQDIHLNIMNQRIDIMPEPPVIQALAKKGFKLSQTTAHKQYSNQAIREKFGIPLHKLSVYATPERYQYSKSETKEKLILISPDSAPLKQQILDKLTIELPEYEIQIINGITYQEYLKLVQKASFTITFGEGLDFYLIETVFSGGVAFAIYNENFFTPDFKGLNGIYNSDNEMLETITDYIKQLENNPENYLKTNQQQFEPCHKIYNYKNYQDNLSNFYKGEYLFP